MSYDITLYYVCGQGLQEVLLAHEALRHRGLLHGRLGGLLACEARCSDDSSDDDDSSQFTYSKQ